jgi:hypothetical protein
MFLGEQQTLLLLLLDITLWLYLLYYRDAILGQLENRINPGLTSAKLKFMRSMARLQNQRIYTITI